MKENVSAVSPVSAPAAAGQDMSASVAAGPDAPAFVATGPGANALAATGPDALLRKAELAMKKARTALVLDHPFFGSLALRLRFKQDTSCADMWTDGKSLGFNPAYAATLPEAKLVAAQAHEVMHLAFGHHLRRKSREEKLWNRACDLAINHILLEAGFDLPEGFAHDPTYAGMSADDIYEALAALPESASKGEADNDSARADGEDEAGAGAMNFDGGKELGGKSAAQSQGGKKENPGQDGEDQAQAGTKAAKNKKPGAPVKGEGKTSFTGEVRDHPDLQGLENDHALKLMEQEADVALSQAVQRAKHMGSLPAGFTRLLKKERRPELDWRELLRRFLEQCADNDYAWSTPNRRYLYQHIYLPARREARLPHVVLAVDCSGSVDEAALSLFCSELFSVLDAFDTMLTVLFHDTKVQGELTFDRMSMPSSLTPVGGGGTDYRPVCAHIEERQLRPTCLVWFTDLECSRFPDEPDYPVLWVCSESRPDAPPFGELVTLTGQASRLPGQLPGAPVPLRANHAD